jgi:hypothetical protein
MEHPPCFVLHFTCFWALILGVGYSLRRCMVVTTYWVMIVKFWDIGNEVGKCKEEETEFVHELVVPPLDPNYEPLVASPTPL